MGMWGLTEWQLKRRGWCDDTGLSLPLPGSVGVICELLGHRCWKLDVKILNLSHQIGPNDPTLLPGHRRGGL